MHHELVGWIVTQPPDVILPHAVHLMLKLGMRKNVYMYTAILGCGRVGAQIHVAYATCLSHWWLEQLQGDRDQVLKLVRVRCPAPA